MPQSPRPATPGRDDAQVVPHVVIVGGGIAGLAAAHRLVEWRRETGRGLRVTLLEASGRLGGAIETEQRDGFLIERGPDSFISEKPWALALCRRLGLESELIGTNPENRTTFVVRKGRLAPLPAGFMLLAPTRMGPWLRSGLFSWTGKLRAALDLALPRAAAGADESLGAFVRRRFGNEVLERIAQPLIGGIYGADPDRLSLAATMPRFLDLEREYRSVTYGLWRTARKNRPAAAGTSGARWSLFVTPRAGVERIVSALADRLENATVRLDVPVSRIRYRPQTVAGSRWSVETRNGETIRAAGVVLATPAQTSARLVHDLDAPLGRQLAAIPYSSAATVNLAYPRDRVPHPLDGFGFVVPRAEHRSIMAATFSSVKYAGRAPAGHVLLRAFVGGALQPELFERDDSELLALVRGELRALLGVQAAPLFTRIARYPQSMPQYRVGHLRRVAEVEARLARHPGLALAGNAYRGVGLADCVRSGEAAAQAIVSACMTDVPVKGVGTEKR